MPDRYAVKTKTPGHTRFEDGLTAEGAILHIRTYLHNNNLSGNAEEIVREAPTHICAGGVDVLVERHRLVRA